MPRDLTPEERERKRQYDRRYRAKLSPEQRQRVLDQAKAYRLARSPEQVARDAESRKRSRAVNREWENEQRYLRRLRQADRDPDAAEATDRARRKRWREANPDLARERERVKAAKAYSRDPERFRTRDRRRYLRDHPLTADQQRELYQRARALAPASLPRDVRDDVVGQVLAAVVDGRLSRRFGEADVKAVVAAHFRQFSKFSTVSIDEVIGEDGFTRGALLGLS